VLVVVALSFVVWHVDGPTSLDPAPPVLTRADQHFRLFSRLTWLGSPIFVASAAGVLAVVTFARRDWFSAALCVVGPGAAGFLTEFVLKPMVERQKGSGFSFPSGHTTGSAALAALVVLLAYRRGGLRLAAVAAAPAACLPLIVSLSVVRVGYHY